MKQGIHPTWYNDCQVTCSCGNKFTIGSVNETLHVDICNKCHPFFTGEMKFVDRQGRVDRFNKKMQLASTGPQQTKLGKKNKKTQTSGAAIDPKTYKDILRDEQGNLRKQSKEVAKAA